MMHLCVLIFLALCGLLVQTYATKQMHDSS